MNKTLDLIRNADDSTMVDFRRGNQIDSVPINDLRAFLCERVCSRCDLPITNGSFVGDGDGTGQQFAHFNCYYPFKA